MENITLAFIFLCFAIQISFWIISAPSAKKTTRNKGGWTMRIIAILVVLSAFFRKTLATFVPIMGLDLWDYSNFTGILADVVTLLGMTIMIWSRKTLGKNWSANVTQKEGHELITTGPYAYVRHPIYSGLVLMILGIAIYTGSLLWLILSILFFFGARYKAHKEEKLLLEIFPTEYLEYKKRVKALIPGLF
jgi:protein-S-isoprenylcysteine O-methyltransferase Ste14